MILQHKPMRWPPNRVVDWADAFERRTWVAELREHLFDLFAGGFEATQPPRERSWTRLEARESVLANKEVLDKMLYLAGAPIEVWRQMWIPLRESPEHSDPPESSPGWPSPFEELPRYVRSPKELTKYLGYVDGQIEYLAALVLEAYPEGSKEHRRARWAVIRLRVLLQKLEAVLGLAPVRT